ncbi:MAG: 23S rRNA (uracil(1939)-C(5))-methyltransferase RlmD [Gammaproteobacteria bacterium]|nr:23S rRNA (uracil(1939)-C(5))-methyltransferase RlmD [Gammaproteobacteria bacterium]
MARRRSRSADQHSLRKAHIDSLSHEGKGVARVDGKAVFIEGALPGENVEYLTLRRRKSYDEGRVVSIENSSPQRVAHPKCEVYGVCGGCSLQHLDPKAQIEAKQQVLLDNLERIAKLTPETVLEPITGPVWGYRRKARLGVRYVPKKGGTLVGFRERAKGYLTVMSACEVLDPVIGSRIEMLRALIDGLTSREQIAQIEVAVDDQAAALVFRNLVPLDDRDKHRLIEFGRDNGIQMYQQSGGPETISALWPDTATLEYSLPEYHLRFEFRPTDFVQVNAAINSKMVSLALALLALEKEDRVLDLFCGLGNFSLALASQHVGVVALEADGALIQRAKANAIKNGFTEVDFRVADLYQSDSLAKVLEPDMSKLLLDPPRTGALDVVQQIGSNQFRRIVYVSCNPATLARDAQVLVHQQGYKLASVGVMDMFPHTRHVESIALFTN